MDREFKIVYRRNGRPCGQSERHFDSLDAALRAVSCRTGETAEVVQRRTGEWTSTDEQQTHEWLETMLAYAVNLMSQMWDQVEHSEICATTGPSSDPDMYDPGRFMAAVRAKYPSF